MIGFTLKGIVRDRSRSLLPVIIVSIGAMLTVAGTGWIKGIFGDIIAMNAKYSTGHVKILTAAYAENESQAPNDLALTDISSLLSSLKKDFTGVEWVPRIHFGGLIDIPDSSGVTKYQGNVVGRGVDLFSAGSRENERMNIAPSIVEGKLPENGKEILISHDFAKRFNLKPGDKVTFFGSSMNGGMVFSELTLCGTIKFGSQILDRGGIICDVSDAQQMLDMEDASSEILGYFKDDIYSEERADSLRSTFNSVYFDPGDEFSPKMLKLSEQNDLDEYLAYADRMGTIIALIFIFTLSVVLWNTGLLGGLRRYNEYGIRLALGEEKKHIYFMMLYEALIVGIIGSVVGSAAGLSFSYWLQETGLDFGDSFGNITMMMPQVFRARVVPEMFYIGFIPGVVAMLIGTAIAGIGIFKRDTARLFTELEV
ncbi:MAG: FtsX-like permease family protein [Ignavibacteriaceae bacterium]|nr:FtsX-like permease family protein [Ignavibacteriaceae bacterium]